MTPLYPNYRNEVDPALWTGSYPPPAPGGPFEDIELLPHPEKNKAKLRLFEFDPNALPAERIIPKDILGMLKESPAAKMPRTTFRVNMGQKIPDDVITYDAILKWIEGAFAEQIGQLPTFTLPTPQGAAAPVPNVPPTPAPAAPAPVAAPPAAQKIKVKVGETVRVTQRRQYEGEIEVPAEVVAQGNDAIKEHVKSVYATVLTHTVTSSEDGDKSNVRTTFSL